MNSNEVLHIVDIFEQADIPVWLDGGWGVDALIQKQTRQHSDLDVVVSFENVEKIIKLLKGQGYKITENELPTKFVMKDKSREIDFHTVTFDAEGGGNQKLQDGRVYRYAPEGFNGIGFIDEVMVNCISPEVQADCHYGYEPNENDRHDMKLLQNKFGIELKEPYNDSDP